MNTAQIIVEKLDAMFPDKNLLNMTDIAQYTGLSKPYVKKRFGLSRGKYLDKAVLASILAEE